MGHCVCRPYPTGVTGTGHSCHRRAACVAGGSASPRHWIGRAAAAGSWQSWLLGVSCAFALLPGFKSQGSSPCSHPTRNTCPASGSAPGKAGGRRWEGLASARFARWGTQPKGWRGPASPDHIPESAPIVLVQPQCQQPLVLALDLDVGRTEGVCHCLQQGDSPASPPWQVALPTSPPLNTVCVFVCFFLLAHGPGAFPATDLAVAVLQAALVPAGLGVSAVFSQPVIRNSEHSLGCWGRCLLGSEVA